MQTIWGAWCGFCKEAKWGQNEGHCLHTGTILDCMETTLKSLPYSSCFQGPFCMLSFLNPLCRLLLGLLNMCSGLSSPILQDPDGYWIEIFNSKANVSLVSWGLVCMIRLGMQTFCNFDLDSENGFSGTDTGVHCTHFEVASSGEEILLNRYRMPHNQTQSIFMVHWCTPVMAHSESETFPPI